jgi:hypothetical protein
MRIEIQKTAWILAASWALTATTRAGDDPKPPSPPVKNTVRLEIQISGLGAQGAKVAIKPAHPGCKFDAKEIPIAKGNNTEVVKLKPIDLAVSSTNPDRDCSFEITLTEPGREPRTFRRGLRLNTPAPGAAAIPSKTLKCYLPATAVAVKDAEKTPRR